MGNSNPVKRPIKLDTLRDPLPPKEGKTFGSQDGEHRVLSIDGGGIRGVLTAQLLVRLIEKYPTLLDRVDLFAGTSTGSFIAVGLAYGYTPQQILRIYTEEGDRFLYTSFTRRMQSVFTAQFGSTQPKKLMQHLFYEHTLAELPRKILVPAFDLHFKHPTEKYDTWRPKIFDCLSEKDRQARIYDVLLSSSAAPSFFPTHNGYCDGGVVFNNPSLACIADAIDPRKQNMKLENVQILNLGTGTRPNYIVGEDSKDWGLVDWITESRLLNVFLDSSDIVGEYTSRTFLGKKYFRLSALLTKPIGLDSLQSINELIQTANQVDLQPVSDWLIDYGWVDDPKKKKKKKKSDPSDRFNNNNSDMEDEEVMGISKPKSEKKSKKEKRASKVKVQDSNNNNNNNKDPNNNNKDPNNNNKDPNNNNKDPNNNNKDPNNNNKDPNNNNNNSSSKKEKKQKKESKTKIEKEPKNKASKKEKKESKTKIEEEKHSPSQPETKDEE